MNFVNIIFVISVEAPECKQLELNSFRPLALDVIFGLFVNHNASTI